MLVHTIGHSTRSSEELLALLTSHGVRRLVDVRRFPASRRHPHLAKEPLGATLAAAGIDYVWMEALGGRRDPRKDTPHRGWRERGFAGYADYMDTEPFATAAARLALLARELPTAVMCAEAVPERCHRRLIADWLVSRGLEVGHILAAKRVRKHELTSFARLVEGRLVYDATTQGELEL